MSEKDIMETTESEIEAPIEAEAPADAEVPFDPEASLDGEDAEGGTIIRDTIANRSEFLYNQGFRFIEEWKVMIMLDFRTVLRQKKLVITKQAVRTQWILADCVSQIVGNSLL